MKRQIVTTMYNNSKLIVRGIQISFSNKHDVFKGQNLNYRAVTKETKGLLLKPVEPITNL